MRNRTNPILSLILIALFLGVAVSGCKPAATPTEEVELTEEPTQEPTEEPTPEPTEEPTVLTVWADDTRAPILLDLADELLADYNVQLVIEDLGRVQDIRAQALIAIPAGEGPDIYLGVHDWLGALIESGLAAPIDLGDKAAEFIPVSLEAFTYTDGLLYGMPYATENLGFFYNTELVAEPPTTWDGVLEVARTLKAEGKVDYAIAIAGDPGYNSLPIQTAFGGYVFGVDANGAWNPQDVGLDSEGEIAAVTWMKAAVDEGLMPAGTDYETGHSLFETGKTPFLMAGPWALDRIRASGVPYAVADFFPTGTVPGVPFNGVQGFFVNPLSENILLAQAFLTEYIATPEIMTLLYETGNRASAFTSVFELTDDPDLKAMGKAGANAVPMPNIPEMGSVWGAWNGGITIALNGTSLPDVAMKDAASQIRTLIAGALVGMVNLPGSYQDKAGCGAAWDPACSKTAMKKGDDGLYTLTAELPAGSYEFKVALDGSWAVNYGSDGSLNGPNYLLELTANGKVTFTYNPETHLVETKIE